MGVKGSVGGKEHTKHALILGEESLFRLNVPKILVMGQSNVSFWEGKRKLWVHSSLIKRSVNEISKPQLYIYCRIIQRPLTKINSISHIII
jgi:hypothetical protein